MLKRFWRRWWPLLIVIGVFAGSFLVFSPRMPDGPTYTGIEQYPSEQSARSEWSSPMTWATVILAAFAAFQYFEFRRSSERQLRAYVNISAGGVSVGEAALTMKNFGQTPAKNLKFWLTAELRYGDDVPTFERPSDEEISGEIVLAPGADFIMRHKISDFRIPLTKERSAYYVYGIIRYEDIFKRPHTTSIRFYRPEHTGEGALIAYDDGNEAT